MKGTFAARVICLLLAGSLDVIAQTTTASLSGLLTDSTGATITSATVTARDMATHEERSTATDATGHYNFTLLPPGTYQVRVQSTGFRTSIQGNVILNVGASVTDDVTLTIGSVDEVVQVTTGQRDVESTEADVSKVIGEHEIESLPTSGAILSIL